MNIPIEIILYKLNNMNVCTNMPSVKPTQKDPYDIFSITFFVRTATTSQGPSVDDTYNATEYGSL